MVMIDASTGLHFQLLKLQSDKISPGFSWQKLIPESVSTACPFVVKTSTNPLSINSLTPLMYWRKRGLAGPTAKLHRPLEGSSP
jgi:hypothetical protein